MCADDLGRSCELDQKSGEPVKCPHWTGECHLHDPCVLVPSTREFARGSFTVQPVTSGFGRPTYQINSAAILPVLTTHRQKPFSIPYKNTLLPVSPHSSIPASHLSCPVLSCPTLDNSPPLDLDFAPLSFPRGVSCANYPSPRLGINSKPLATSRPYTEHPAHHVQST